MSNRLVRDATAILNKNAVQFDAHRRYNNQAAWPFWYPLVPKPYLETDTLNNGLGLLGHTIEPDSRKEINVQLDRDSVYRLINLKYTASFCAPGTLLTGTIIVTAGSVDVVGDETLFTSELKIGDPITYEDENFIRRCSVVKTITDNENLTIELPSVALAAIVPYNKAVYVDSISPNTPVPYNLYESQQLTVLKFLRITVVMSSLGTKYLMGGTQVFTDPDSTNGGLQERPILMAALQGFDQGLGQLRTPSVFAYDSSVKIIIENLSAVNPAIVNGTLFGYKISPGDL